MKKFSVLILLSFLSLNVLAQQDPVFSQFMFNQSYWSPALLGVDNQSSVSLYSRSQWVGYSNQDVSSTDNPPSTQFLNFTLPLSVLPSPSAVGANFIFDRLGPSSSIQIQFPFAYHIELPRGIFSMGLRPSVNNFRLQYGSLRFVDERENPEGADIVSDFGVDLDAGIGYTTEKYTLGLGVFHLLTPDYEFVNSSFNGQLSSFGFLYNAYGEYRYQLSYKWKLAGSALVQINETAYSINVGAIATYKEKFWGGLSYRHEESAVLILGYSFLKDNSLKIGYSLDYVLFERQIKSQTSQEIYLRYNLPSLNSGSKKIIRTPRFRY